MPHKLLCSYSFSCLFCLFVFREWGYKMSCRLPCLRFLQPGKSALLRLDPRTISRVPDKLVYSICRWFLMANSLLDSNSYPVIKGYCFVNFDLGIQLTLVLSFSINRMPQFMNWKWVKMGHWAQKPMTAALQFWLSCKDSLVQFDDYISKDLNEYSIRIVIILSTHRIRIYGPPWIYSLSQCS